MSKTYITTIIEDGEDQILPFPDTLIEDMGWKEGDTLQFECNADHAVIRKIEDPTVIARLFEGNNENSDTQ